jgi:hypothetical protein
LLRAICSIGPGSTKCGDKSYGLPTPLRRAIDQALAAPATAVKPQHLGIGGGLVDKDQMGGIKYALLSHPAPARPRHVRALLLRCAHAFFEGNLVTLKEAQTAVRLPGILCLRFAKTTSSSVRSGCFSIRPNRKSAYSSNGEIIPPRGLAAQRPVSRKHLTQMIAVLALTANSSAASPRSPAFHFRNHALTHVPGISLRHRPASQKRINAVRLSHPSLHENPRFNRGGTCSRNAEVEAAT